MTAGLAAQFRTQVARLAYRMLGGGVRKMPGDVFPSTARTWIDRELDRGESGRLDVCAHVMKTYSDPLRVYFLGTNLRWLGEPEEIVAGFFASRLDRLDFLSDWRSSGLRLRRWLMNGLSFYLMEQRRERRRELPRAATDVDPVTFSGDPHAAVDRAAIVSFVRQALDLSARACIADGLETHWRIFLRHQLDGIPFSEIAREFDVDPTRAAVMSRTATRRFRAAIRDVLARDGAAPHEIDDEIQSLLLVAAS